MFRLPKETPLGELTIVETFEFFDFPRLFSAKSLTGGLYLGLSIFDGDDNLEWLYLNISPERARRLVCKEISLHEAFINPENKYLLKVVTFFNGEDNFEYVFPEQLSEESLPLNDAFIEVQTTKNSYGLGEIIPNIAAKASHRETFNLHIQPPDTKLPELNTRSFGNMLVSIQELVDALGQVANGREITMKGAISEDVLQQTKLNTCQIFEGSFGVQLKSSTLNDIFDDSLLTKALFELKSLLTTGDKEELLNNKLHALKGRVASKYRLVLKELHKLSSGIKFDWGSPNSEFGGKVELTKTQIDKAYALVDRIDIEMSESIEINSNLIGLNIRTKRYEIESLETNESFSGRVADDAVMKVKNATINRNYKATIKKLIETKSSSGDEKVKWILYDLTPL